MAWSTSTRPPATPRTPASSCPPSTCRAPQVEWAISCIPAARGSCPWRTPSISRSSADRGSVCGRGGGLARRPDGGSGRTDELQPGLALDRVEQRARHLVIDGRGLVERNREPDHHLQSRIGEAEMALGAQPAELEGEVLREPLVLRLDRIAVLLEDDLDGAHQPGLGEPIV